MERNRARAAQAEVILARAFYERETTVVARELLGKLLANGETAGVIVETEAYLGGDDLAAHSAAGITPRTRVIFGPPGHAYVYLSYGMHDCLNIVADREGTPGCVLIRALEPVRGLDIMRLRRPKAKSERELASGPGRLTQALGITRQEHNGADVTGHAALRIEQPSTAQIIDIETTRRIGITKCADWPLRFVIRGNRFATRLR